MARPHKKNPIKNFGAVTSITMLRPGLMHTRARSMAVSAASIHDTLKVGPACCWLRKGGRRGAVTGGALTFLPHETAGARRHARAAGVVSAGAPEAEKMDCARRPDEQRCAGAAARGALACARGGARTTANAAHCERRTGKTFHALRSVAAGETGAYCGPLRLLAWEVHEKLNEGKITGRPVACDLITGQERVIVPNARHRSSTIEMVDMNRHVDVAVIDEVQMIASPDRGWAWTRAVLGLPASELHLCGEQRSSRAACAPPLLPACASPGPAGLRVCISRVACVHACACILVHACMCVFVCHGCVRAHVRCVVRVCTRARACVQCVRQIRGAAATALRHVRRHLGNTRISASDTPRGTVSPMMCVCVCVCAGKHAPSPPTRNPKPETLKPQP